jgi:endonuclease III
MRSLEAAGRLSYDGLKDLTAQEIAPLIRRQLLAVPGIGPETADCIALYVLAQEACRARPRCTVCPLDDLCPKRGVA